MLLIANYCVMGDKALWTRVLVLAPTLYWDDYHTASGQLVVSFSMLSVNANKHPVMRQFHKQGDEKRTPVIIASELHDNWLSAEPTKAAELMTWSHMPELNALQYSRT